MVSSNVKKNGKDGGLKFQAYKKYVMELIRILTMFFTSLKGACLGIQKKWV